MLWSLLGFASCAGLQAVETGLNFARDGGGLTTGTADGCSVWTNVRDTDGFPGTKVLTGTKITAQWHASNSWYAGAGGNAEQRIYACYLDDGQSSATPAFGNPANDGIGVRVKLTGMSRWLALNEHLTYKIRAYGSTDTDGATFQPVTIRDGGGASLATFTRAVLGDNDYPTGAPDTAVDPRGYGDSPDTLAADTIILTIPRRAGTVRGCLAALKIVGVGTGSPLDHFEAGDGTVSVANAHLGAGLTSVFQAGSDHPAVTGDFNVAATHNIEVIPPSGGFVVQSYNLITLPAGETLDLADLSLGTLPRGVVGGLELDTSGANPVLKLTITDLTIPSRLFWTGAVAGGAWDVDTTNSWSYDGAPSGYLQGDEVVFDDTATGTTSVALHAAVLPFSVVVENDETHPYSITGPGSIDGSGGLSKRGIGTLTLGTANGYAGLTTIESGTLVLGANAALGATSGGTTVMTDTRIDLNGYNIGSETLTLNGSGPDGGGSLVNGSITTAAAANAIVLSGDVTIGGSGDLSLGSVTGTGASLTKVGTGKVTTSSAFGFNGIFTLDEGTWEILAGATLASCSETRINDGAILRTVGDNKTFGFLGGAEDKITIHQGGTLTTASSSTHLGTLVFDGGTLSADTIRGDWGNYNLDQTVSTSGAGKTSLITGGNVTLSQVGGTIFDIAAGDALVISSKIDGDTGATDQGLIKNGTGTLVLTATNTHDSPTSINAGTLVLTGSLRNTSAVTVASGATLGGTGTANGSVTVQTGGIIAPGDTAPIGTLTLGSATMAGTFQCQLGETTCDRLAVTGALDLSGGTIELTILDVPTAPALVLASAASITGTPVITGTLPDGYTVQTTATQVRLVSGSSGFSGWIGSFGLAAADQDLDDDPDADGLDNGIEYVLGGNPASVSDAAKLPQGSRSGDDFVFSFDRVVSSETPDVFMTFQYGDSLDSWDSIPVDAANPPQVTITRSSDNLTDRIVVTIPATGTLLFGRLSVTTTAP